MLTVPDRLVPGVSCGPVDRSSTLIHHPPLKGQVVGHVLSQVSQERLLIEPECLNDFGIQSATIVGILFVEQAGFSEEDFPPRAWELKHFEWAVAEAGNQGNH